SLPFLIVAQPACGTLLISCPMRRGASLRSTHSSSKSFTLGCCNHSFLRLFKKRDHSVSRDGRKTLQEVIDRFATFDILDERLDGNPRSRETWCSAHHLRVRNNDFRFHVGTIYES